MPSGQKLLSRRHLLSLVGGAAGAALAGKTVANALTRTTAARQPGHPNAAGPKVGPAGRQGKGLASAKPAGASKPATAAPGGASSGQLATKTVTPKPRGPVMRPLVVPPASAAVAALFGDIGPGTSLGGSRVVRVHDVFMGAIPVVLETEHGRRFQVDVLRRSPEAAGVADTRELSVYLSNQGSGRSRTNERQGLTAMALATALARQRKTTIPRALLTLGQRARRFPRGGFAIPVQDA